MTNEQRLTARAALGPALAERLGLKRTGWGAITPNDLDTIIDVVAPLVQNHTLIKELRAKLADKGKARRDAIIAILETRIPTNDGMGERVTCSVRPLTSREAADRIIALVNPIEERVTVVESAQHRNAWEVRFDGTLLFGTAGLPRCNAEIYRLGVIADMKAKA